MDARLIGAGATASSKVDWREAWLNFNNSIAVKEELNHILTEGRKRPPIAAAQKSAFATS